MFNFIHTHAHVYMYVFVCMFVMNLTLKFACAINANILFLFFVFLCPLPAARVCKNVPHVLTKWGKVVDRARSGGGEAGLLGGRGSCVCRFAFEVCQRGA